MTKASSGLLTTPPGILSFPDLAKARAVKEGDPPKFAATIIFHEDTDISDLKAEALAVMAEAFFGEDEAKAKKAIKTGGVKWPFRRDLSSKPGYEERAGEGGTYIIARANEDNRPGVVFAYADPDTGKPARVPEDQVKAQAYPGTNVRLLLQAYSWTHPQGGKGVSFGLAGVQLLGGGERFDGRISPEDAFEADDSATAADFEGLPGAVDESGAEQDEEESSEETSEQESEGSPDPLDDL